MRSAEPLEVFIIYAREDVAACEVLCKQLSSISRQGMIEVFSDLNIEVGQPWKETLDRKLLCADIFVWLISADFLASKNCQREVQISLEMQKSRSARILPIRLRSIDFESMPQLATLQQLPRDGQPILEREKPDPAFAEVASEVRRIVQEHLATRPFVSKSEQEASPEPLAPTLALNLPLSDLDGPPQAHELAQKGANLHDQQELEEAHFVLSAALAKSQEALGRQHPLSALRMNNLALVLRDLGRLSEAAQLLEEALLITRNTLGPEHPSVAIRCLNLSLIQKDQGKTSPAEQNAHKALSILTAVKDSPPELEATALNRLALLARGRGAFDLAASYHRMASTLDAGEDLETAQAVDNYNLGLVLSESGKFSKAQEILDQACIVFRRCLGLHHPIVQETNTGNLDLRW